ncbi:hypothetical protein PAESOLCIP111_01129 [Paenibacillus solanacearum]|uniref:Extracellular solute-binding protein n=1 Tax=Paenibacillus solanacearum TaxID=2048548 RepID=A0A916JXN5_9BACL|nr:extracellular solute-binding protein [Paenibacillus solanacearum]CAG7609064.1 hypothetical protein PAESOLCIP111_01129 [Paenibacillus solanacearum]
MHRRWLWGAASVLFAATAMMSGCSSAKQQTSEKAVDQAAAPKKDPVELSLLMTGTATDEEFEKVYGAVLKKKFPHVTFKKVTADNKIARMEELVSTGQPVDLIFASINYTSEYIVGMGLGTDISDLIKSYKYDTSVLEPSTLEMQKQIANGGIYGLPVSTTAFTVFYNKDIFDRFGVGYPKDGMTWDEMYSLAQKVTRNENGNQYYGFLISPLHYLLSNQRGLPMLDPKTQAPLFTEEKYKAILENLIRFYQIPGAETNKYVLTRDVAKNAIMFFENKNVAMYAYMNGLRHEEMDKMNWDIVSMPSFKDSPGVGTQSYPGFVYLSKTSKHREQAFEVMAYLTSEEYQRYQAESLATSSILKNPDIMKNFAKGSVYESYYKGKNIKALLPEKFAPYSPKDQYTRVVEAPLAEAMMKVAKNQSDINTALRQTSEKAVQEINKVKQQEGAKNK